MANTVVTLSTAGTTSWQCPFGVSSVQVELWGGGGTGGPATGTASGAGGGAGGQYAIKQVAVTAGTAYAVIVAAASTANTTNVVNGNDSTFASTTVVAKGGAGGVKATSTTSAGGTGSSASGVGDTVFAGGSGGNGVSSTSSGGGGGGAGSSGAGNAGSGATAGVAKTNNGGAGGAGVTTANTNHAGSNYGGGGSGGLSSSATDRAGGNGAQGLAVLTYTTPLMDVLSDDFTGTINTAKWFSFANGIATVSQTGGQVVCTPGSSTATVGYAGYDSQGPYDLTGSFAFIEVVTNVNAALGVQSYFKLLKDGSNVLQWIYENGTLKPQKTVAGTTSDITAGVTYNSTTHKYWKIRESGGTIFFDYSSDGITWVNHTSLTNPFAITSMSVEFAAGTYQSVASPGAAHFECFNIGAIETKTQGSVSRIANTETNTQSSLARIANNRTKTQSATANILNASTVTKNQTAISRIANVRTKTQSSIARTAKNLTKTQTATAHIAIPTTYYVSATGSDSNSGLDTAHPWQTITHVNAQTFNPGDNILFQGGDTFTGKIFMSYGGSSSSPIVFGSYGTGKATINNTTDDGFFAKNAGYITVQNLNFTGGSFGGNAGIGFFVDNTSGTAVLNGITISGVDVSGFQFGISIGSNNDGFGYNNVTIQNSVVHGNRDSGLVTFGPSAFSTTTPVYNLTNFTVSGIIAHDNAGNASNTTAATGNGIVLGNVQTATIDQCTAYNNGANNAFTGAGPVGIWTYDSDSVIIKRSVAYNNKTNTVADGDGFDLDINVTNSTIEYCLAYGNYGAGFLVFNGSSSLHSSNVVRYNMAWGNGQNPSGTPYGGFAVSGTIGSLDVYNNTFVARDSATSNPHGAWFDGTALSNVKVRNNIFYAGSGNNVKGSSAWTTSQVLMQGNDYFRGAGTQINWGGTTYSTLAAWRAAITGQEVVSAANTGFTSDPGLVNASTTPTVTDPTILTGAANMELTNTSAMIAAGLPLNSDFGTVVGSQDYFGTALGSSFNVGASQLLAGTKTQSAISRVANNKTKTQSSIARTSNVFTKTQTAAARIAKIITKTQPATARISNGLTKTQSALARIANNKTKTQTAIARVANALNKTQTAIARIVATPIKTQSSIARISNNKTKTQTATARIDLPEIKIQSATARIANNKTKTQSATANISNQSTLSKTQTAIARIQKILTDTQSATARIQRNLTKVQTATARIDNPETKTQSAKARIQNIISKTQPAIARIANGRTKTQTATARIDLGEIKTQTATARIQRLLTKTQSAISRIARTVSKTQSATARIDNPETKTQTTIARISETLHDTQNAKARISGRITAIQSVNSLISMGLTSTQTAKAHVVQSSDTGTPIVLDTKNTIHALFNGPGGPTALDQSTQADDIYQSSVSTPAALNVQSEIIIL